MTKIKIILVCLGLLAFVPSAQAGSCRNRFGIGAGLVHLEAPSMTKAEVGAEYECRSHRFFGFGGFVNYIFADPGITYAGLPEIFFHPFGGSFYLAASPLLESSSAFGTNLGVHTATRLPLPLGLFILVPSFAVDFIRGTRIYWFSLGIAI